MKIAIIDPVGAKMGMNHYNDGLLSALSENGFETYIFSNYISAHREIKSKIFFENKSKIKIVSGLNNFSGILKSLWFCKIEKIEYALFHIFRGGFFDLISLHLM